MHGALTWDCTSSIGSDASDSDVLAPCIDIYPLNRRVSWGCRHRQQPGHSSQWEASGGTDIYPLNRRASWALPPSQAPGLSGQSGLSGRASTCSPDLAGRFRSGRDAGGQIHILLRCDAIGGLK
jgi:hypothetical protein